MQWFEYEHYVIMYLGNAVVDKDHQKYGVLTASIYVSIMKMVYQYYNKQRFVISMATTPDAFTFYKKLTNFWPNLNAAVPDDINTKLNHFCQTYCNEDFIHTDNFFIATNMHPSFSLKEDYYQQTLSCNDPYSQWFREKNPNYKQGEQLVCMVAVDKVNLILMSKAFYKRIVRSLLT